VTKPTRSPVEPPAFRLPKLRLVASSDGALTPRSDATTDKERPLSAPTAVEVPGARARIGRFRRERVAGVVASLLLHILVAAVVLLWRDELREMPEPSAIQVEFAAPEAPPPPAVPPVRPDQYRLTLDPSKLPDYGTTRGPLLKLDPSLKLDRLSSPRPGHGPSVEVPDADSGNLSSGDPVQNYALVVVQMVRAQLQYPASALAGRGRGIVKISVELGKDGELLNVQAASSSLPDFAAAARDAAHAAAPFPPFPQAAGRSKMVINFAVVFQYTE
jgi:TonB family protein